MNKSNLYKGCIEPIILQLLKGNTKLYGYQIIQSVSELTQNELLITEGGLYPLLHKMELNGLVATEEKKVENRVRKYYKLTPEGRKAAKKSANDILQFVQTLQLIFEG